MTKQEEMDSKIHEEILAAGRRRFPIESYRQLRDAGARPEEALEMLGFSEAEVPPQYRE